MRKIGMAILVLCLVTLITACGKEPLKVGIDYHFKPFGFTEDGERKGFDEDLWKAVAKQAGFTYQIIPMSSQEILEALKEGKIDVGLAGFSIKGERKKTIDFSTPYYDAGLVVLTHKDDDSIKSTKELRNKVIATRMDSTGYIYVGKIKGVKEVRGFPNIDDAYQQLINKQVDAVIFDSPNVFHFINNEGKGKVKSVGMLLSNEQYGIAVQKGSHLLGRINNALRDIGKNGTYEKIYMKWFHEKPKSIPGVSA